VLVFVNELGGMLAPVFRMLVVGVLVRMRVNRTHHGDDVRARAGQACAGERERLPSDARAGGRAVRLLFALSCRFEFVVDN